LSDYCAATKRASSADIGGALASASAQCCSGLEVEDLTRPKTLARISPRQCAPYLLVSPGAHPPQAPQRVLRRTPRMGHAVAQARLKAGATLFAGLASRECFAQVLRSCFASALLSAVPGRRLN